MLSQLAVANEEAPRIPEATSFSAYPSRVLVGANPKLNWYITFPKTIDDVVNINPDGSVTTKDMVDMTVRVLGASSQFGGQGWKKTQGAVRVSSAGYVKFFEGVQPDVKPTKDYHNVRVNNGSRIDFRGRNEKRPGQWNNWWSTESSSYNVLTASDGDLPPIWSGSNSQRDPKDFVEPYLDGEERLKLGPRDIIIFFELGNQANYYGAKDTQDLVLLVTFETVEETEPNQGVNQ